MNITSLEKCASARAAEPLAPFKMRSLQPKRPSQGGHSPDTYFKLGNILLAPSLSVKTLAPRLPGGCVLAHLVVCILRRRPFSLLRLGNEREHFVGRWSSARRASPPSPFCPLIDSIYSIRGSGEENEPFPPPILRSARPCTHPVSLRAQVAAPRSPYSETCSAAGVLVLTEEVAAVVSVLPSFSPSLACPAEKDGPSDGFPPRDRGREGGEQPRSRE